MKSEDKVYEKPLAQYFGYHKYSVNNDLAKKIFPDPSSKIKPKIGLILHTLFSKYFYEIMENIFKRSLKLASLNLPQNDSRIWFFKYIYIEKNQNKTLPYWAFSTECIQNTLEM